MDILTYALLNKKIQEGGGRSKLEFKHNLDFVHKAIISSKLKKKFYLNTTIPVDQVTNQLAKLDYTLVEGKQMYVAFSDADQSTVLYSIKIKADTEDIYALFLFDSLIFSSSETVGFLGWTPELPVMEMEIPLPSEFVGVDKISLTPELPEIIVGANNSTIMDFLYEKDENETFPLATGKLTVDSANIYPNTLLSSIFKTELDNTPWQPNATDITVNTEDGGEPLDYTLDSIKRNLDNKQASLVAGDGIEISSTNEISVKRQAVAYNLNNISIFGYLNKGLISPDWWKSMPDLIIVGTDLTVDFGFGIIKSFPGVNQTVYAGSHLKYSELEPDSEITVTVISGIITELKEVPTSLNYLSLGLNMQAESLNKKESYGVQPLFADVTNEVVVDRLNLTYVKDLNIAFGLRKNDMVFPSQFSKLPTVISNCVIAKDLFRCQGSLYYLNELYLPEAKDCSALFIYCRNLQKVNFILARPTDISHMFFYCNSLLEAPYMDTRNVTNMSNIFNSCRKLETLPSYNTQNVINMNSAFYACSSLKAIPSYNTQNVTKMSWMLYGCSSLTTIPLLNTSNVIDMDHLFHDCHSLTSVPQLNTSNATDMSYMFLNCNSLISVPQLDTFNVTTINNMFGGCSSLTTIPLLNTSNVIDMAEMFNRCSSLTTVPALDCTKVTNMHNMFNSCANLQEINILNINADLDIHWSTKMQQPALHHLIDNLVQQQTGTTKTLTLGSTLLAKITEEYAQKAAVKGWTLV